MDRMDWYYTILMNISRQCEFLFLAYCLVMWVKPFLPRGAKVYRVGVAYVAAMMITNYIPLVMSGTLAYGIGIGTAFFVMCLLDREYIGQKIFLAVTFNCLRWQIYRIIIIILDVEMWVWSTVYVHTMERGNIPWIFNMFGMQWFWLDVMGDVVETVVEFLLMYGAVRFMLYAYGRKREHMGLKEFVLLVMPVVSGLAGEEIIRYHRNIYAEGTGKSLYDLNGYDLLITLYAAICFATILTMTYVYRRWKDEQADVNGSVARKMEDRAGVLEAKIKQDSAMGAAPTGKEEALAETQAKANEAASAQMGALAQANQAAEEAAEADKNQSTAEADRDKDAAKADEEEKEFVSGVREEEQNTFDTEQPGVPFSRGYQPVDVKL